MGKMKDLALEFGLKNPKKPKLLFEVTLYWHGQKQRPIHVSARSIGDARGKAIQIFAKEINLVAASVGRYYRENPDSISIKECT